MLFLLLTRAIQANILPCQATGIQKYSFDWFGSLSCRTGFFVLEGWPVAVR